VRFNARTGPELLEQAVAVDGAARPGYADNDSQISSQKKIPVPKTEQNRF
jgi:hypothetical protein